MEFYPYLRGQYVQCLGAEMNIQLTLIRHKRITKTYDDRCAETHEEFEMLFISEFK